MNKLVADNFYYSSVEEKVIEVYLKILKLADKKC